MVGAVVEVAADVLAVVVRDAGGVDVVGHARDVGRDALRGEAPVRVRRTIGQGGRAVVAAVAHGVEAGERELALFPRTRSRRAG